METPIRVILIDDDQINNFYSSIIIEEVASELEIKAFVIPEKGFEYLLKEYSNINSPTVLFLDINMPTWSGWDFLDNFEKLDKHIQGQIKIYILSSSVDPADRLQAGNNRHVMGYIEKPLSGSTLLSILESQPILK